MFLVSQMESKQKHMVVNILKMVKYINIEEEGSGSSGWNWFLNYLSNNSIFTMKSNIVVKLFK